MTDTFFKDVGMREGTGFRSGLLVMTLAGILFFLTGAALSAQAEGGMGRRETLFRARIGESQGAAMAEAEKSVLLEAVRPMVHPLLFDKKKYFLQKH